MNKQQLAQKIWASANQMRSKIEANEYKDYILGFMFYKYLSDKERRFLEENGYTKTELKALSEEKKDDADFIRDNIGYFISYENLFSTWIEMGNQFQVGNVRDALSAFGRNISKTHRKVFDKIFDTLQTGLSKLGDSSGAQTKAISGLLHLIKDIPMSEKQDYDVLGFIYEYLVSMFAANAGKKAGEFYTPHEVSVLMSEIVASHLKNHKEIKIYDPTSGSASLLVNIGNSISKYIPTKDSIMYYAQELKENTYNLTRMNLVMRDIKPSNIEVRNGDTLEEDWPYFDENDPVNTYAPLYVDAVVSNPPYSQQWDSANKETDPRFARFGLAPKSKADYAFLLHSLYHIKPDGIMTIVLPHGVLFRGGEEGEIRKNLIEFNHIDAVIGLPPNIFFGTGIPTIVVVLRQKREHSDVLIIDASKGFVKEGKNNKLRASDIKKIVDTYINRASTPKFSRVISRDEIRENDYNLNIPRYVDSSEAPEQWDIYASMFGGIPKSEIDDLGAYWDAFPVLKHQLFQDSETPYSHIAAEDVKTAVKGSADVLQFQQRFASAFASFPQHLEKSLIEHLDQVDPVKTKTEIADEVFRRLSGIPLIDKYEAFQILDDAWAGISVDLEILQTEGFAATRAIDPNMVVKKKDGKDVEVPDGWTGRVIPFSLVQSTFLREESDALTSLEHSLSAIPSEIESVLESLSDEDKEDCRDAINEEGDAFVPKELPKIIKELRAEKNTEYKELIEQLSQVEKLLKTEKELKTELKRKNEGLLRRTKETIETLTDEQARELLRRKWILPLSDNLHKLTEHVVDHFARKIEALAEKYKTTFFDIESQIKETERELAGMIDELVGNEYDMKGLAEFKALLLGDHYE